MRSNQSAICHSPSVSSRSALDSGAAPVAGGCACGFVNGHVARTTVSRKGSNLSQGGVPRAAALAASPTSSAGAYRTMPHASSR
eukprot:scaffold142077_cov211-Phaeocystis_antarctica.AAC.1